MLCLLCISYVFYCFFVFFIYVFICSYSIFHCFTVFLSIFYRLLMALYFSFLQHCLTFFPYFPNEFSFLNNFPPTYMYKLNNIDFCIPEMFCILPSPVLEWVIVQFFLHSHFYQRRHFDMNFFNENNLIFVALNKIGDIILANLLFILCSIPLVTIGPSLTALYHCMLRTVKGNNNGTVKTFFRAFRQSFRQSLIVCLGLVVVGLLLFLDTRFHL